MGKHDEGDPGIQVHGRLSDEEFNANLSAEMVRRTARLGNNEVELAIQVKDAREFIEWSSSHLKTAWLDWYDEAQKAMTDMRTLRMALERETKVAISAAKDLKTMYDDPSYVEAHKRLHEMVDLLERLGALKQNGTLDAMADFILKIQCVR